MVTKGQFKTIADNIVEMYGVASYQNNVTSDMTTEDIYADLWCTCTECDEPILYEDFSSELEILKDEDGTGDYIICPVCGARIDLGAMDITNNVVFTVEMECDFNDED